MSKMIRTYLSILFFRLIILQQHEQLKKLKADQITQVEYHQKQIKEHEEALQRHKDALTKAQK